MDFGYTLLAAVLLYGYIGMKIDDRFHKKPLFMIIGMLSGILTGFASLFRRLNVLESARKRQEKDSNSDKQ
jgi:ATP synthase protein I